MRAGLLAGAQGLDGRYSPFYGSNWLLALVHALFVAIVFIEMCVPWGESEPRAADPGAGQGAAAAQARRARSATRFIARCRVLSKPSRFRRTSVCSALTITPSKKASTGPRSAASRCSDAV